jgi:hypothetical protein
MKKIILLLAIIPLISSCSTPEKTTPTEPASTLSYNKLKAYNKIIAYYYYSPDATKNGNSRIYLDTISNIITQYTSHRETNQSDTSESFGIKSTVSYPNYKNTNIDYMSYEVINTGNSTSTIMFSHEINTDKFVFKKYTAGTQVILSHDPSEYYKKMY